MLAEDILSQPKPIDQCIVKMEKFDIDMAKHLVSASELISSEEKRRIKIMIKDRQLGNSYEVKYRLGKKADATSMVGHEFNYLGRWCASKGIGLQGLQHNIRGALAHKFYWDVDMVNAQPVMLLKICKDEGWKSDCLEEYITRREELFLEFERENPIFTRGYCKTATIKLLFGGVPDGTMPQWLEDKFYPELHQIMKNVAVKYPAIYKVAKRNKPLNPLGCCCANVLQTEERKCLMALDQFLTLKGRNLAVLIHDGGYVEKLKDEVQFPEFLLRKAEQFILTKLGYKHTLMIKPITTDFEVPNKRELQLNLTYPHMKADFESTHFKNIRGSNFYEIVESEEIVVKRCRTEMKVSYEHLTFQETNKNGDIEEKSFIDKWLSDPKIRTYNNIDFLPPPLACPVDVYNLWTGFKAEGESNYDEEENVQVLLDHIKLIAGDECYDYFIKWLALMFQKPAVRPNVCIMIKSRQGLGKGLLYTMLNQMIGSKYCMITENIDRDVFGDFNDMLDSKILTVFDEMNMALSKKNAGAIKDFITNSEITINPKGQKKYTTKNLTHTLVFTNNEWAWKVEESDRRTVAIDRYSVEVPEPEYFQKVADVINNQDSLSELLNYFMKVDISNFNPAADRPKTSFMKDLKLLCRPIELEFFIHMIQTRDKDFRISAGDLFEEFKAYVNSNYSGPSASYSSSTVKLALKLKSYQIGGCSRKVTNKCTLYEFNIQEASKWVNEKYP